MNAAEGKAATSNDSSEGVDGRGTDRSTRSYDIVRDDLLQLDQLLDVLGAHLGRVDEIRVRLHLLQRGLQVLIVRVRGVRVLQQVLRERVCERSEAAGASAIASAVPRGGACSAVCAAPA